MRTDENNNPTAMISGLCEEAKLKFKIDWVDGTSFLAGSGKLYTAKLIGDPIEQTIRVIDAIGFYTEHGAQRWEYIAIPHFTWLELTAAQKRDVIGAMYQREGGVTMRGLFPNYGKLIP